ncbi:beta-lactamase family protein [Daldinia sp. FL1419]|nr:beta-lactamase family protein [Daldinia sp. FL1419]
MDAFRSESFSSYVKEMMEKHHVPGFSIAIVHNGETASAGYGYADVESSKPCTADTLFDIASSSKSFTAAAAALLVDDDKKYPEVQYEAIMSRLLPGDFVMPSAEYTDNVTLEDILSHRSGMPRHDDSYMGPHATHPDDPRSITKNLRNLPVAVPLRAKHIYCNMMYTVAAYLVEEKTQQSFSSFLEERFFKPLGMESTSPSRARAKGFGDRLSAGYAWVKKKSAHNSYPAPDCVEGEGAGSIVTSVNDLIKWVKALLYHEGPITEEVYQGLVRLRSIPNPDAKEVKPFESPEIYAAGVEVYWYRGYKVIGHDGAITGFHSRFFLIPELSLGVAMLGNDLNAEYIVDAIKRKLIDSVLNIPEDSGKNSDKKEDKESEDAEEKRDEKKEVQQQTTPLSAYVGKYWNPGYHTLTVQAKDEKLFVDCTDRSFRTTLTFEHVSDQTKYIVHLSEIYEEGDEELKAEFVFEGGRAVRLDQTKYIVHLSEIYEEGDEELKAEFVFEGGRAVRLGIDYQEILKKLIWFELVPEEDT